MNQFIIETLKPVYRSLKSKVDREFYKLSLKLSNKPRFKPGFVKVNGLSLHYPDAASFFWQFKEIFLDEDYKFNSTSERPLILDCGSNIGTSCIYFKKLYPKARILAFEPSKDISYYLKENLINNGIKDIEICEKAVWINNADVEFLCDEGADGSSIKNGLKKIKVPSIRLKDILNSQEKIDLLKMDIEGAEVEVLEDCKGYIGHIKNIFIEYHSFRNEQQNLQNVLDILTKNSFRYFLKTSNNKKSPMVNHEDKNPMDLQVNIFAIKGDSSN